MASTQKLKVLVMGGTRFSGLYLARELALSGHQVVLFNRGRVPMENMKVSFVHCVCSSSNYPGLE